MNREMRLIVDKLLYEALQILNRYDRFGDLKKARELIERAAKLSEQEKSNADGCSISD